MLLLTHEAKRNYPDGHLPSNPETPCILLSAKNKINVLNIS